MRKNKAIDIKVGLIGKRDLKNPGARWLYRAILVLMWSAVLVCLIPPLWIISSALKDVKEIHQVPPTFIPRSFQPWKLVEAWKKFDFSRYYMNTLFLAVVEITIKTMSNGLVAYTLSRIKPAGYKIMLGMILSTFLLPGGVALVPTYMTWMDFPFIHVNFLNTYWPFIIGSFAAGGMNVIIYKSFFDNIPNALIEAAKLDGSTEVGTFFRIVMPICKPIIVTTVILGFNGVWSDFLSPFLYLTEKSKWTVMVYAYKLTGLPVDEIMIVLTFAMIPPMLVFFIFQKHIMNGFTMSGVKE